MCRRVADIKVDGYIVLRVAGGADTFNRPRRPCLNVRYGRRETISNVKAGAGKFLLLLRKQDEKTGHVALRDVRSGRILFMRKEKGEPGIDKVGAGFSLTALESE